MAAEKDGSGKLLERWIAIFCITGCDKEFEGYPEMYGNYYGYLSRRLEKR